MVLGKVIRQDFDGDVTLQLRVGCAVDLPHAARTDGGGDFIASKLGAKCEGHDRPRLPDNCPPEEQTAIRVSFPCGLYNQIGISPPEFLGRNEKAIAFMLHGLEERSLVFRRTIEQLGSGD